MAPRNDVLSVDFTDQTFKLIERQEYSRSANGVTYGKSMGSSLWQGRWVTAPLYHDDALDYEAILRSLDGVIGTFYGHDLRRPYPRAHADGVFADDAEIAALGVDGKSMALDGLSAGFILSRGDYLAFDYGSARALHQAMESVVADGTGTTPSFEVRPHIRQGATLGAGVTLKRPSAIFALLPGTLETTVSGMTSSVSFEAIQVIL